MSGGFFVTGTDTGVGKTRVSVHLLKKFKQKGLTTAGLKPIASGCKKKNEGLMEEVLINEDALLLQQEATEAFPYSLVNPFAFEPAIAPHLAANKVHPPIDLNVKDVWVACQPILNAKVDVVIVEGAGGLCVPLNSEETMIDLARRINFPLILVVGLRLGCLNHALLTWRAIQAQGLRVAGWVAYPSDLNMECREENIETLKKYLSCQYLGLYPNLEMPRCI